MVVVHVWLGLYFVSAKYSLAAHKIMLVHVVHILAQERHVFHMEPYTQLHVLYTESYMESFTLSYVTRFSLSLIEVMCINHAYYGVSYPSY